MGGHRPAEHSDLAIGELVGLPLLIVAAVCAAVWLVTATPPLVTALARMDWWLTRALLDADRSRARVEELTQSRARVVDAAEAERSRIERDLHDGAQQRLIAVSISLGRARSHIAGRDDEVLRSLLDDAHLQTRNAIADIRALTRGLRPPILTDRGLDTALSSVAALCSVPVDIVVAAELTGPKRPSATVESTIYFLVSEALTNASKHSGAGRAGVSLRRNDTTVAVIVEDDGCGGAAIRDRGGLAGMADRLSGMAGTLTIDSLVGGPTRLCAEVPCV